jgi:hypothetical protein
MDDTATTKRGDDISAHVLNYQILAVSGGRSIMEEAARADQQKFQLPLCQQSK